MRSKNLVMILFSKSAARKGSLSAHRLLFSLFIGSLTCQAAGIRWEAKERYRSAQLPPLGPTKTGFTLLPGSMTGMVFTNNLSEDRIMANANLLNGSGVALGDYDGDGLCDIYLCDLNGKNALFRNL